ncbi:MAG: hypothetical protein BWY55_00957 [archaeon ADurb.Bin336]|nr:MAG: hypothetical protein BWY55_00957 [archaeon ADurb.Bin336]
MVRQLNCLLQLFKNSYILGYMKTNKFQFQPVSQNDLEKLAELIKEGWSEIDAINFINDLYLEMEQDEIN